MKKLIKGIIKKISGILLILVAITIWIIHTYQIENISIQTNSGILSGTKIGWGIKRAKDHEQPDVRKNKQRTNGQIQSESIWEIKKRNMCI